jgi:hypothetical protein
MTATRVDSDDSDEYDVFEGEFQFDEIVGDKIRRGTQVFEVKWTGFPESENTWESSDHLPAEMVKEYLEEKEKNGGEPKLKPKPIKRRKKVPGVVRIFSFNPIPTELKRSPMVALMDNGDVEILPLGEVQQRAPGALLEFFARIIQ